MTERRVTATRQFSTVIDALQLGQKTGILTVERGEGGTFEEGTMTFANGQVVNATLGASQGRDAATTLFSWQECRFSFVSVFPEQSAASQELLSPPAEPMEAGVSEECPQSEFPPAHPGGPANMSHRPFPTTDALESLDTILAILDRQGFTRTHRRLFSLIDGKRSVEELSLLVRRAPDEIMALLADLERAGFIQL